MPGDPYYVIDAHAVLEIPRLCKDTNCLNRALDLCTNLVRKPCLTFPDLVRDDCRRYEGEAIYTWMKAVSGSRKDTRIPDQFQEQVMSICEELADPDDEEEQTQVMVAAMAMMLRASNPDTIVITEDRRPQPTRLCLADACSSLGLVTATARELLEFAGAAPFLR